MEILHVVKSLLPNQTDLIDNFLDKKVASYVKQGYKISDVKELSDLKAGDKYVDTNGEIRTKE